MYSIREANQDDYSALPLIEQAASTLFLETGYKDLASGPNVSEHIDAADRVWVTEVDDRVVAFALAKIFDDVAHIHEIDVHPQHARRGLGRALITHIARWSRIHGIKSLTLTTFNDVPWNGPYYARLGFVIVDPSLGNAHLNSILEAEAALGWPMEHRVAMQLML
jgi:GNAT superfamily N-acetyltransferase